MPEGSLSVAGGGSGLVARVASRFVRQREFGLLGVMIVLGAVVALKAPQFLSFSNLQQVTVLASIIAVAAIGQALVVLTRNVDLSVESTIGLVAYCVASLLEQHALTGFQAMLVGVGIGLLLGMINATWKWTTSHASAGTWRPAR